MATIAVTVHLARQEAVDAARELVTWLRAAGHTVSMPTEDAVLARPADDDLGTTALVDAELAVSLGGDGTVLRTLELLDGADVPVLGVNLGQLGYLTEIEPGEVHDAIERVLAGEHEIEERMLLEVRVESRSGDVAAHRVLALNEVALDRTLTGHTVRLDVSIDGEFFTPYEADGLIVGTPTGSTAYAFSAGGPIVAPNHRLLLLTPVSPHMLFDRTVVLEPQTEVRVAVSGHRPAALAVDGRLLGELAPGDAVMCTAAPESAQLVVFGPRHFPRLWKTKFKLSDR